MGTAPRRDRIWGARLHGELLRGAAPELPLASTAERPSQRGLSDGRTTVIPGMDGVSSADGNVRCCDKRSGPSLSGSAHTPGSLDSPARRSPGLDLESPRDD